MSPGMWDVVADQPDRYGAGLASISVVRAPDADLQVGQPARLELPALVLLVTGGAERELLKKQYLAELMLVHMR